jgi:cell division septum initiation protein DivIVA
MPESLESFVKKLQSEGVEAGKEAAEKIKKEAKREAEKILADAKAGAEKIVAKAESDAERQLSRAQNELELAVRDAILKLGESLGHVLSVILARRVEQKLSEPDYIGEIMREVIIAYAKADAGQEPQIEINIQKKMRDKLNDSALKDLFQNLHGDEDKLALEFTLSKAGFEYKIHGATVEVSPDSVSELLSEMVNPDLQEIIANVVGKMGKKSSNEKRTNEGNRKDHSRTDRSEDPEDTARGRKR